MASETFTYQQSPTGSTGPGSLAEFNRLSHVIGSNLQKIASNVSNLERLVEDVGTECDTEQTRQRLHETQHFVQTLIKDCVRMMNDYSQLPPPGNDSDRRQCKLQRERLCNEFSAILNKFQAAQRSAAQKEKASVVRARAQAGIEGDNPFANDPTVNDLISVSGSSDAGGSLQIEQNVNLQEIREREASIRQLESDITDVNHIFTQIAEMVHDQGFTIDSIEDSVENALQHTERGQTNLAGAAKYSSALRRKQVLCISLAGAVIVIICVIVYYSSK